MCISSFAVATRGHRCVHCTTAIIWGTVCLCRHTLQNDSVGPTLGSALCGLSVLIEHPSRQAELAMYVTPRALQTVWALMKRKLHVSPVKMGETALLCGAVGLFMAYYCSRADPHPHRRGYDGHTNTSEPRDVLKPAFRALLRLLMGHERQYHV